MHSGDIPNQNISSMSIFSRPTKHEIEVAKRITETCDNIMVDMGAEIHDDLIQKLYLFRLLIDRLERSSANQAEVDLIVIKMNSEFHQLIKTTRRISRRLLPADAEGETFATRIEILCQNMQEAGTTNIHFESIGPPVHLAQDKQNHLFRITQELIANALKHSCAWHVWVTISCSNEQMILEVEDDGTNFSNIEACIEKLKRKNNTLKLRTNIIGASIVYLSGTRGLIARIELTGRPL